MKFDKYVLLGVSALLITAFLWGARWYRDKDRAQVDAKAREGAELLVRSYSPTLGPSDAKVTIVEFFDPECEACRAFYPLVKQVLKEFNGKVRLVMRYMPFHKNSFYAASVLEAARKQGKYWEALEMMFARQPEWASHHDPKPELLMGYMKTLGLDLDTLKASLQDSEPKSKIQQDQQDGTQLGVTGTPTFFVNGKVLQKLGPEELRAAIKDVL